MSKPLNLKYTVTVLPVNRIKEKIRFQIRHPENVSCITGIAVTTSLKPWKGDVGLLTLSIPGKGDVFFSQEVKEVETNYNELIQPGIFNPTPKIYSGGKRLHTYFDTNVPVTESLLEGFYESFVPLAGGMTAGKPIEVYRVTIYLRYERIKKEEDDSGICT